MRGLISYRIARSLTTFPRDGTKPENLPDSSIQGSLGDSPSNVPRQCEPLNPPNVSTQAYESPKNNPSTEAGWVPITSEDWRRMEADIEPVPERDWQDSDSPVPLNKDWPLSQAEFDLLPPEEQRRLKNEEHRRGQLNFIRQERLHDHNHLHPANHPFTMPMVAYHRGYAPEGTTPPPTQKLPWQLRRPWIWIRRGAVGLLLGTFLASIVGFLINSQDEFKLRHLEAKSPAPDNWPEKARAFYAAALRHKNEGQLQYASWALQRALVEAGFQWILEPEKVPQGERTLLNSHDAWMVRMLVHWEIQLEHWDKAISILEGLSIVYEDDNSLNRARRADLLRMLAVPMEKTKGPKAASSILQSAMSYADYDLPKNRNEPIVLPKGFRASPLLLRALEDYIILQVRHGFTTPKRALPTLLSIANAYRDTPYSLRDVCGEGSVMLHIGEILYALDHREDSFKWTEKAVKSARKAVKEQTNDEDRQRCSECVGNGCNSLGILYEVNY